MWYKVVRLQDEQAQVRQLMANSMVGMPVEDILGIGVTIRGNMRRKGFEYATQIFGQFLALQRERARI